MKTLRLVRSTHYLVVAMSLLLGQSSLEAQQSSSAAAEDCPIWMNIGMGGGSTGVSLGTSLSYELESSLLTLRYIYNKEIELLGDSTPWESVSDIGVLYGIMTKASYGMASLSAGISTVRGVRRGGFIAKTGLFSTTYAEIRFSTAGIPLEGRLYWRTSSSFGIGIYVVGNLNDQKSFIAAQLSVEGTLW
ncbi:MAG: hypothetical protein V1799_00650 [bacterium]